MPPQLYRPLTELKSITMKKRLKYNLENNSGFIVADFLFAFVMIIGIGIFIFGFTFSLATIEVAQYIVWSTARNYSAGNEDVPKATAMAKIKFSNLTAKFPLLTGNGESSPWFELLEANLKLGDLSVTDPSFQISGNDKTNDFRQPWTGASAVLNLKLFSNMQIPFLGKVANDKTLFEFPVRAFIIRSPSAEECRFFFYTQRWDLGIKKLENGKIGPAFAVPPINGAQMGHGEDNGC